MKRPTIGTCALCRARSVRLLDSHVFPAWCYRRIRGDAVDGNPNPVLIANGKVVQTSRPLKAHLLCESCEQRFSVWENYVSKLAARADGSLPITAFLESNVALDPTTGMRVVRSRGLDEDALFRFALSVLWRADLVGRYVDLGERYREIARRFLFDGARHPEGIHIVQFAHVQAPDLARLDRTFATPTMHRVGNCRVHAFPICGLEFWAAIGRLPEPDLRDLCLLCSSEKRIVLTRARESLSLTLLMRGIAKAV